MLKLPPILLQNEVRRCLTKPDFKLIRKDLKAFIFNTIRKLIGHYIRSVFRWKGEGIL